MPLVPSAQDAKLPYTPENELHWYWKNGLRFSTDDRAFDLRFTGMIQFDASWIGGEDALEAAQPGSTEDGAELRRFRFSVEGTIYEDWYFRFQPELAGDQVRPVDMLVGRAGLFDGRVDAQVGQFKEAIGLEEVQSIKSLTFLEKALPTEAFAPSRSVGVAARGNAWGDALLWNVGVFRADTDEFGVSQGDGGYAVTGRVGGTPYWEDGGRRFLHLGAALSLRDDEEARFRSRPEVHLTDRFLDTGALESEESLLTGLELAGTAGPIHGMAEYLRADVEAAGDPAFDGWYVQLGWFATGEARPFKRADGVWDRLIPKGERGALELAARYSTLDLDDAGVLGGAEDNVALAVNWYVNPNLRFGVNYVAADVDAAAVDETLDAVLLRVQVDW